MPVVYHYYYYSGLSASDKTSKQVPAGQKTRFYSVCLFVFPRYYSPYASFKTTLTPLTHSKTHQILHARQTWRKKCIIIIIPIIIIIGGVSLACFYLHKSKQMHMLTQRTVRYNAV